MAPQDTMLMLPDTKMAPLITNPNMAPPGPTLAPSGAMVESVGAMGVSSCASVVSD
jgi:hypothetical protein